MPGAETISRSQTRDRELNELEAQRPELSPWLRPLRVALGALADAAWAKVVPVVTQARSPDTPVLDGAIVALDTAHMRAHVRAVLAAALGPQGRSAVEQTDEITLLERAINHDESDAGSPALSTALQLSAVPLFITLARHAPAASQWTHGYCYVCGALPVFAEVLGLERTRQLRCGRCSTAWKSNVLVCSFCGETDHARLGSLVPDGPDGQICWVETCSTCQGYLKTRAALRSMPAESVLVEDARTIDLDLVATERGFSRPSAGGRPARIHLTRAGAN